MTAAEVDEVDAGAGSGVVGAVATEPVRAAAICRSHTEVGRGYYDLCSATRGAQVGPDLVGQGVPQQGIGMPKPAIVATCIRVD